MKVNYIILISLFILAGCKESVKSPVIVDKSPTLYPDYVGVTVPATIAPLNFTVKGKRLFSFRRMNGTTCWLGIRVQQFR
jgi:hypothetical protein